MVPDQLLLETKVMTSLPRYLLGFASSKTLVISAFSPAAFLWIESAYFVPASFVDTAKVSPPWVYATLAAKAELPAPTILPVFTDAS